MLLSLAAPDVEPSNVRCTVCESLVSAEFSVADDSPCTVPNDDVTSAAGPCTVLWNTNGPVAGTTGCSSWLTLSDSVVRAVLLVLS